MESSEKKRIVICGGAFSDNLGDAVIADCFAKTLQKSLPEFQVLTMDLAGRTEAGGTQDWKKSHARRLLRNLPGTPGRFIVGGLLLADLRMRIEKVWDTVYRNGDTLVIGGGQLLQDGDLNYPLKLYRLTGKAKTMRSNLALHAVGVGKEWSKMGRALFKKMLMESEWRYFSVRDEDSKSNLLYHLPLLDPDDIKVELDPALLSCTFFSSMIDSNTKIYDIGIGVTNPEVLCMGSKKFTGTSIRDIAKKWGKIARQVSASGLRAAFFSNGAHEDDRFLARVGAEIGMNENVYLLTRPSRSIDLIGYISRMQSLVSHRLHAAIIAYSLNIPAMGLSWDGKVDSFFKMCNRMDCLVDFMNISANDFVDRIRKLVDSQLDQPIRRSIMDQCQSGIDRLAQSLTD